jgi:hypothetical protein
MKFGYNTGRTKNIKRNELGREWEEGKGMGISEYN